GRLNGIPLVQRSMLASLITGNCKASTSLCLLSQSHGQIGRSHLKIGSNIASGFVCSIVLLAISNSCLAQQPSPQALKLSEAVDLALTNYPSIRVSLSQAAAAREGIGLARTSYLPRTDLLWQENRATRNNFFGLVLPQAVIPAVSGPVLA